MKKRTWFISLLPLIVLPTISISSCGNDSSLVVLVDNESYDFLNTEIQYLKSGSILRPIEIDFKNQIKFGYEVTLHNNVNKIIEYSWSVESIGKLIDDEILFVQESIQFDLWKKNKLFKTINIINGSLSPKIKVKVECSNYQKITSGNYLVSIGDTLLSYNPIKKEVVYYQRFIVDNGAASYFENILGEDGKKYYITRNKNWVMDKPNWPAKNINFSNITFLDENFKFIKTVEKMLKGVKNKNRIYDIESHDALVLGLNHYILPTYIEEYIDYFDPSIIKKKRCLGVYLQEVLNDKVVWEWESGDYEIIQRLSQTQGKDYVNFVDQYLDDAHFNSLTLNKDKNSVTISLRNCDCLINIDRNLEDYKNSRGINFKPKLNWIISNNYNNVPKNACLYADKIVPIPNVNFSCQHFIKYLGTTNNVSKWSFYNNNTKSHFYEGGLASGVEFSINESTLEISNQKVIRTIEEIQSVATGSCYQLPNSENWLVCWGIVNYREKNRWSFVNELAKKEDGSYESVFDMYQDGITMKITYRAYKSI